MNNTNRLLNRVVIVVVGVVLVAAGAAVLVALAWPVAAGLWHDGAQAAQAWSASAHEASLIGQSELSWLTIGVVAGLVLLAVLLLIIPIRVIARRSRPRARGVVEEREGGRITVSESFTSDALRQSLARRDELLSVHVGLRESRGDEVLHVAVTPRQSTPPSDVAQTIERLLDNLATLTGRNLPTLVSVHAGIRTRLSGEQRRVD